VYDDAAVNAWIQDDPDPVTRAELTELLAAARSHGEQCDAAQAALADAFSGTLTFGTAGLRGRLGGGPNRMNRVVVIRAAAGLSAYLKNRVGEGFSVVIGYDARHNSEQFARDTAAVVTGAGGRAILFESYCPTPVLAFALRRLEADAGVMVTASHNPPQDNGYKVYLGGLAVTDSGQGAQIVPPYDTQIAEAIDAVGPVASVPRPQAGWETVDPAIREEYIERAAQAARMKAPAPVRIVLTAMHGVGGAICREVLARVGFTDVVEVAKALVLVLAAVLVVFVPGAQAAMRPARPTVPPTPNARRREMVRRDSMMSSLGVNIPATIKTAPGKPLATRFYLPINKVAIPLIASDAPAMTKNIPEPMSMYGPAETNLFRMALVERRNASVEKPRNVLATMDSTISTASPMVGCAGMSGAMIAAKYNTTLGLERFVKSPCW